MKRYLLPSSLLLALAWPCPAQQVGEAIVVIAPKGNIQLGDKVVDVAYQGAILVVRKVHEDWLSVSQGTPGWIHKDDVMLLGRGLDFFSESIRQDAKNAGAYFARGNIRAELGEFAQAVADYAEAIKLDPKDSPAYNGRGFAYRSLGQLDKALADYNQAIQLNPKDPWAYNNRGVLWLEKKEYDKAIADFDQVLRLDKNHTFAHVNRGNALAAKGDYAGAVADFDEAIRRDPRDGDAYLNRGMARQSLGEYARALEDYNLAVEVEPKRAAAYEHRALLLAACPDDKLRDGKKAVENATRACELTGWKDPTMLSTLAAAHAEAGDLDGAVRFQARVLEIQGKNAPRETRERLELYRKGKKYRLKKG
jgi:tetratricopeptide (TPR) repeat protein